MKDKGIRNGEIMNYIEINRRHIDYHSELMEAGVHGIG